MNIERFAAQRQKHAASFRQGKLVKICHQQRVDFAFVKAIRSVPIFDAKKLPSIARLPA
jgi:hypothetical protein